MRSGHAVGGLWRRRRFLGSLLTGGAAGLALAVGRVTRTPHAWGAPAAAPSPPGAPPDKGGASGITVKPDDPAISAGPVEFPGLVSTLLGYVAAPKGGETYPGILLVHDADGLSEHQRDVARRLAKAGYVTLVPDLLSRAGGTEKMGSEAKVAEALTRILIPQFVQDGNAAVRYLGAHPLVSKTRVGMMAFGLGGILSWYLLAANSDVKAGAIFYGRIPNLQLVPHITAAVLAIYGESDGHDADDLKDFDVEMKKAGRPWTFKIEPKATRGFFDDTRRVYAPDAAKDAWKMSLDWYASNLTG